MPSFARTELCKLWYEICAMPSFAGTFRRKPALCNLSQETCEVRNGERDTAAFGGVDEALFQ